MQNDITSSVSPRISKLFQDLDAGRSISPATNTMAAQKTRAAIDQCFSSRLRIYPDIIIYASYSSQAIRVEINSCLSQHEQDFCI